MKKELKISYRHDSFYRIRDGYFYCKYFLRIIEKY